MKINIVTLKDVFSFCGGSEEQFRKIEERIALVEANPHRISFSVEFDKRGFWYAEAEIARTEAEDYSSVETLIVHFRDAKGQMSCSAVVHQQDMATDEEGYETSTSGNAFVC